MQTCSYDQGTSKGIFVLQCGEKRSKSKELFEPSFCARLLSENVNVPLLIDRCFNESFAFVFASLNHTNNTNISDCVNILTMHRYG